MPRGIYDHHKLRGRKLPPSKLRGKKRIPREMRICECGCKKLLNVK